MRVLCTVGVVGDAVLEWTGRHGAIFIVVGLASLSALGWTVHKQQQEISRQRVDNIASSCEEQTARNRRTTAALDIVLAKAFKHARPAQRLQLQASRAATVLLINALAPIEDCDARVFKFTGEHLKSEPHRSSRAPRRTH
jgi:hypothetical protein